MIKANELRIGNWIADRGGKQWQIDHWEYPNKVASIEPYLCELHGHYIYGHPLTEELDYLQPIPLTTEILEKCGISRTGNLAKSASRKFYRIGSIIIESIAGDRIAVYVESETANILIGFQDYLHQLQNLYYALTGEELTYTP